MDTAQDISLFMADFGVTGTLAGATVRGIFDEPGAVANVNLIGVETTDPSWLLAPMSVPAGVRGAAVVIPGKGNFKVKRVHDEAPDLVRVFLERTA